MTKDELLNLIPQQAPFRFIDKIIEVDDESIVGQYTFKQDETFYQGHFPGNPVTPGVILLETMAQTALVAFGLYLGEKDKGLEEIQKWLTLFSDANVEFSKPVFPGDTVTVVGKKIFWRRMKLKVSAVMTNQDGIEVSRGELSGVGGRQ